MNSAHAADHSREHSQGEPRMSRADEIRRATRQAPGLKRRMAIIAMHLTASGFRLRNTIDGWRIEPRTSKATAGRRAP